MRNSIKKTYKVAFGGIIAALCAVLMFLTGLIPFGTYALPALAGMLLSAVVVELGYAFAFSVYAVVCVLSFFFAPDKEAALIFTVFLGYYPILKAIIESKLHKKPIRIAVKLLIFNASMVAFYFLGKFLLSIPDDSFVIFGVFVPYVFLAIGNVFFIMYDYCITVVIIKYIKTLRPKLFKNG